MWYIVPQLGRVAVQEVGKSAEHDNETLRFLDTFWRPRPAGKNCARDARLINLWMMLQIENLLRRDNGRK
jgi:hypothetical protein